MLKTLLLLFLFLYFIIRFSGSIIRIAKRINRVFSTKDDGMIIRHAPSHKKSRRNFTDGEYVDYEEIK